MLSHVSQGAFLLQEAPGGGSSMFVMLLVVIMIFYFIVIRPQGKERRALEAMRSNLKKGDEVLTQGGILGRIHAVKEQSITIELEGGARARVVRESIVRRLNEDGGEPQVNRTQAKEQTTESKS